MGSGAMTNSIGEIDNSEVIFITGSNTTENHPVIGSRIRKAVRQNGAKLIVADPRYTPTAAHADLWLPFFPNMDMAMLNSMAYILVKENLVDK
ncbi:MAG: molybdopterin-dependent oxidoreductase, partial [Clostridiales bacterium]|nr:molybdopterin-dependent oxidoreductase [Clostridiales bacterium]